MKAVEAIAIQKEYGDVHALGPVDFSIEKGSLFGFIGPDGAGKTSLFRILTTLLLPDGGSAGVLGYDVVRDFREIRKIVGYMPGRFSLYQDLSVEENLNFFATVFGTTIQANYDLVRDIYVQIEPFRKRLAGRLSGGMKQKLALSCALIHKPEILFLDEPTTGVDAVSRKEFWEMLGKLRDDGLTIVVSTPYMDEASLCDRVALIQEGNILDIDSPDGITRQYPWELYSARARDMYRLLHAAKDMDVIISAHRFGQDIHLAVAPGVSSAEQLVKEFGKAGLSGVEVTQTIAGIEDSFMDLMSGRKEQKEQAWGNQ